MSIDEKAYEAAWEKYIQTVNTGLPSLRAVIEAYESAKPEQPVGLSVPKWGIWWQGSGPERGDHIMEMTASGVSYANEIAYLGDLHHDAAGKIVDAHNKHSGSAKQKSWGCPTCGSDYKPLCHCEAEEMATTQPERESGIEVLKDVRKVLYEGVNLVHGYSCLHPLMIEAINKINAHLNEIEGENP